MRRLRDALRGLDDPGSHREALAERAFLAALEAGCRAPLAARARFASGNLALTGAVFATDGSRVLRDSAEGPAGDAETVGRGLADRLLARGAAELIAAGSA